MINISRNSGKTWMMKTATIGLLINMLMFSAVAPVAAESVGQTPATSEQGTETQTGTAPAGNPVQIPSIDSLGLNVSSAVLLEPTTGEILLSINADEALPPASMTKMMTEYIVAEAVKQGKISWDQMVTVQENASKQIGSRIFLAKNDTHTVRELYIAMAVGSANDATVALAELVGGSEQAFVAMMNETAQKMGMKTAHFINSTGLDLADMPEGFRPDTDRETVMSAMDAATLARYIVTDHPDFNEFTSIPSYQFRERDDKPMTNYNWMLEANKDNTYLKGYAYPGVDGLKTGHTKRAKYCFTGTAVNADGMRLISVVMGTESEAARFNETRKVLDYGFNNFEIKQVVAPKTVVAGAETVAVDKSKSKEVGVVSESGVTFIVPKGTSTPQVNSTVAMNDPATLVAPIEQGSVIGKVNYSYEIPGHGLVQQKSVNLVTVETAEKAGWFTLLFRGIGDFFKDLFDGIKNIF